jgi:hypothetical protein
MISWFQKKITEEPLKYYGHTEMEECAEGFRLNYNLLGRIQAIKRTGEIYKSKAVVQLRSSVDRPIDFGPNLYRWLIHVKSERKRLAEELQEKEKAEKENRLKSEEARQAKALAERKKFFEDFFRPLEFN